MKPRDIKLKTYFPFLFSLVLVSGILLGNILKIGNKEDQLFSKERNKLNAVINYIEDEYVDSVSRKDMTESAIPDILRKLDPHSIYIPARDLRKVNETLRGNFEGIGVRFNMQNDTILIVQVIKGGPSEKIGIEAGDRIIKVNDTLVAGIRFDEDNIVKRLKGEGGSKVKVSIARKGFDELIDFNITRGKIPIYSIDVSQMINEETGYIKIINFSRTTYREFKEAMEKLLPLGLKKLIIDLRANTGGYMDEASKIADEFLEKGKLIVYTEGKARPRKDVIATSNYLGEDIKLVILIDEGSASASEVLAGALQDNDRGIIMGRRSFGKGLVQEQTMFTDGSALRLTIARYYTPTGRSIQRSYKNGTEDYMRDIGQRYLNGELIAADSIHFDDSLKFTTPGGKTVYGGGGIMPDIFVPIDTIGWTKYFTRVRRFIYGFALKYSDDNRNILSRINNFRNIENYLDNQDIVGKFLIYAETKGVKKDKKSIIESEHIIETQLKAYIIRNFLDNDGFYSVIRRIDKTLLEAITLLE